MWETGLSLLFRIHRIYSDYAEMLECLIIEYENMILRAVNPQYVMNWCRLHEGIGPLLENELLQDGHALHIAVIVPRLYPFAKDGQLCFGYAAKLDL